MSQDDTPKNTEHEQDHVASETPQTDPSQEVDSSEETPVSSDAKIEMRKPCVETPTEEDLEKAKVEYYFEVRLENGNTAQIEIPADCLYVLMEDTEAADTILGDAKNRQVAETKEYLIHKQAISEGLRHQSQIGQYTSPFDRENSHWRQSVEHDGDEITAARPRISSKSGKLSGDLLQLRLRAAAGLGTITNVPLWHSGVWLKLKAPSEANLLELDSRVAMEKMALGRQSAGLVFGNSEVYVLGHVLDMLWDHVLDGSVKDLTPRALEETLLVTDIPQLIWGWSTTIWPHGYRLVRPCVNDPSTCNHLDEAHVNLGRLSWVDNRALSVAQRNHMVDREATYGQDALTQYRKAHVAPQRHLVKIHDDLSVRLKVPTIGEHRRAGQRWVDWVIRGVDRAFAQQLRGQERDAYIARQTTASYLRQYAHFIEEIVLGDGDDTIAITDPEDLDRALNNLSEEPKVRRQILKEIEAFQRRALICAIGIPRYDCPKCNKPPMDDDMLPRLQEIILLNPLEAFFTLNRLRAL